MMSAALIRNVQDHAAYQAAQEGKYPLHIWGPEDARHIPFLGPYVPAGWRPDGPSVLVDKTGWGRPDAALTFDQFVEHVTAAPYHAWAIISEGQFQIVAQGYLRDIRSPGVAAPEPDPCEYCGEIHDDLTECDPDLISKCVACGEPIDYCIDHAEAIPIIRAHDDGDHRDCHPSACDLSGEVEDDL